MVQTKNGELDYIQFIEQPTDGDALASGEAYIYFKSGGFYIKDGSNNVYPVYLYSQPKKEIYIRASEMISNVTAGAEPLIQSESATHDVNLISMDFDQTNVEYAEFNVWMPDTWDAGTIDFKFVWTADGGTTAETVAWQLDTIAYADGDAIDTAPSGGSGVTDALQAVGDIHYSPLGTGFTIGGTPTAGELVQFRISRQTGSDNLSADARLLGIKIYYSE